MLTAWSSPSGTSLETNRSVPTALVTLLSLDEEHPSSNLIASHDRLRDGASIVPKCPPMQRMKSAHEHLPGLPLASPGR